MRDEDMQSAKALGFLSDDEKKLNTLSFKGSDKLQSAIDGLAGMDDTTRADWIRDACIEKVLRMKRQFDHMQAVFGKATDTPDTVDTTSFKA